MMEHIFIQKCYGYTFSYASENDVVGGIFGSSSLVCIYVYEHLIQIKK